MARKSRIPRITDCTATAPRRGSFTQGRAFQALFVCLLVGGLGVAQVALRFAINDLRVQQSRLQDYHGSLLLQKLELQRANETLCSVDRLRDFARTEMNMEEPAPSMRTERELPPDIAMKYGQASDAPSAVVASVPETAEKSFITTLLDVGQAYAAAGTR